MYGIIEIILEMISDDKILVLLYMILSLHKILKLYDFCYMISDYY